MQNQLAERLDPICREKRLVFCGAVRWLAIVTVLVGMIERQAICAEIQDPVLNLLLKKGVVSEEEAHSAQVEADAIRTNGVMPSSESKWKISNGLKNVELYGDVRTRFEYRSVQDPNGGDIELKRFRLAVRLGLRGEAFDNFYYGVRLDTASNPRSPWVTLGTSSSGTPYQGPFGKSTFGINVGQGYLGWRGLDWLDISVGKFPNPLYTTTMVWDSDLNPEGATEKFKYTVGEANFFATLGQFVYQDTNPSKTSPGYFNLGYDSSNPLFLLAWQAGVDYHITKKLSAKVAPALYNYTGHGQNVTSGLNFAPDFSGTFVGQGTTNGIAGVPASSSGFPNGAFDGFAANQTGINDLLVLDIPWEINLKLDPVNLRLFGDYAQNLQGNHRAEGAYAASHSAVLSGVGLVPISSAQTHDVTAYQIGLAIGSKDSLGLVTGSTSKRHAWEVRTYWQHVEQYALDPNLLDSDFFEGRGNLEGIYAAAAYGFTDNVIGTVRYGTATRINDKLGTGGSNQDIPQMNPIHRYNILQLDLSLRF
jgi:hypothetical protein